jgi:CubicO group peptidase (beta-lactamase class C family)
MGAGMRHANVKSMVVVVSSLVLAALAASVAAQRSESTDAGVSHERLLRIGQMIDRRIEAREIPGAVSLVAIDGRIVHFDARGQLDLDSKRPMPREAIFSLASLTKPITAAAVLMLVEEGRVRLTDPVSRFIPEFKDLKVAVTLSQTGPASRPITIRDLLTHTSGIVAPARIPTEPTATLAAVIPRFAAEPLEFQPGTRWTYSNTVAFDTLARIVEVVSGKTYDRFLRDRIFEPLGMHDTAHVLDAAQKQRFARRYDIAPNGLKPFQRADPPSYFGGGWGLHSTAQDYFRFAQMLLNKGELDGKRLLSPRAVELMAAVHIPDTLPGRQAGEGWGLGVRVISHAALRNTWLSNGSFGWTGASGTHFWIDPEERLVAVLMAQAPAVALKPDFETLVMQAVVK